ncbi:MAG TPA: alpha/beta hydrolase [Usitatibacter sp.]|nr:alpha/beta hydrolase [Usitatibacter sp.]
MTRRRWLGAAAAVVAVTVFAIIAAHYSRDISAARARIASGARTVATACGPIEYAEAGTGPSLLVVHGAGGGFDQGMDFFAGLPQRGFRVIAVSRFGYLGTPLPADASAAAQARAHACLLDALGIRATAIAGGSAGAPSATEFALLFPDRTTHLVLLVPALYVPRPGGAAPVTTPPGTQMLFDTALRSDFLFWAAIRAAPDLVTRALLATPPAVVDAASADERARVRRIMEHILPVAPRRLGLLNDAAVTSSLPRYELERITAPTLVVTARDDLFGTWDSAEYTARHIPGARLIGHERGGHLLVGHEAEQLEAIDAFLRGGKLPQSER